MKTDRELLELAAKASLLVEYCPESGSLRWRHRTEGSDASRWNARYAGSECGTIDDKRYRRILFRLIPGKTFKIRAHRLAWFISYGRMPEGEIDHINQDKQDNRLINLRDVPKSINQRNGTRKSNNTSGIPGVTWHKQSKKWCAQAGIDGKHHHLGLFERIEDAESATLKFRAANGFTETHGHAIVRAAASIGEQMK